VLTKKKDEAQAGGGNMRRIGFFVTFLLSLVLVDEGYAALQDYESPLMHAVMEYSSEQGDIIEVIEHVINREITEAIKKRGIETEVQVTSTAINKLRRPDMEHIDHPWGEFPLGAALYRYLHTQSPLQERYFKLIKYLLDVTAQTEKFGMALVTTHHVFKACTLLVCSKDVSREQFEKLNALFVEERRYKYQTDSPLFSLLSCDMCNELSVLKEACEKSENIPVLHYLLENASPETLNKPSNDGTTLLDTLLLRATGVNEAHDKSIRELAALITSKINLKPVQVAQKFTTKEKAFMTVVGMATLVGLIYGMRRLTEYKKKQHKPLVKRSFLWYK
jgi:hypothetical protein